VKSIIPIVIILALIGLVVWKYNKAKALENEELNNIRKLPPTVGRAVSMMDPASQSAFFAEYQSNKKSLATGYILWFFFGLHYAYFRNMKLQILLWVACLFGIGFIWWLVDFFRIPSIRNEQRDNAARLALQTLQFGLGFINNPAPQNQALQQNPF